jgi:hypothetical protein
MAEHPKGEALRAMTNHAAVSFGQNQLTQELEDSITAFGVAIQPLPPAVAVQPRDIVDRLDEIKAMVAELSADYRHRYKEDCIRVNKSCTQPGHPIRWPHLSNGQFPQGVETLAHLDALELVDVNNLIKGYAIRHPGPNTQASMLFSVKLHVGIPVPPA